MTLNEYQELAMRTRNKSLNREQTELHALHLLSAEVGEIHSLYQKVYQGHTLFSGDLMKEIGDVLWGLAELCDANGWKLGDIAKLNIEKLRKRYPEGFSEERSVHRDI